MYTKLDVGLGVKKLKALQKRVIKKVLKKTVA